MKPIEPGPTYHMLEPIKRPTYRLHYTNPDCQGSLIQQTAGFPDRWYPDTEEIHGIYLDRIGYEYSHTKLLELGMRGAAEHCIRLASENEEWCRDMISRIKHVRIVYYFNVATGYECPRIDIIVSKPKETKDESD